MILDGEGKSEDLQEIHVDMWENVYLHTYQDRTGDLGDVT